MLTALLMLGIANSPDLDRKISIDCRAGTGKELADELSRKTGILFETADEAVTDRYIVHVKDEPIREVMKRIAEAESGEWIHFQNDGYRLHRSAQKVAALDAARIAESAKRFAKTQDRYRKDLEKAPEFTEDSAKSLVRSLARLGPPGNDMGQAYWQARSDIESQLPTGRMFERIVLGFTPTQLAAFPTERRMVFSTEPTAMQGAIPSQITQAIRELVREQQTFDAAMPSPDQFDQYGFGPSLRGRANKVTYAMLSLYKYSEDSGIEARLDLADAKGRVMTEANNYVQPEYDPGQFQPPAAEEKAPTFIALPDSAKQCARLFLRDWTSQTKVTVTDSMRDALLHPDRIEPQTLFAVDALFAVADSRHENLAAVLDDGAMQSIVGAINEKGLNPLRFNRRIEGYENADEGAGWLVLLESNPKRADESRVSRFALATMLAAAKATGHLTLDDAADFSTTCERFDLSPLPRMYLDALVGPDNCHSLFDNDKDVLQFYGHLSSGQRTESDNLPFGRLDPTQMALLRKIIYWADYSQLQVEEPSPTAPQDDGPYYWNSIAHDATVALAGGIPSDGYLELKRSKDRAILARMRYGGYDQGDQVYDPNSLAWMMLQPDYNGDGGWKVDTMRPADRQTVSITFHYNPKVSSDSLLTDYVSSGVASADVNKLPPDLRQSLQKSLADARKSYDQGGGIYYPGGGARRGP